MPPDNTIAQRLLGLPLRRCDGDDRAGLCIASIPLPRGAEREITLGGRTAYRQPLGQWPGVNTPSPRRMLIVADGGATPADLTVTSGEPTPASTPPTAEGPLVASSPDFFFPWETHALRIEWGGRRFELMLGLRTKDKFHWWQGCRLIVREETPFTRVIEMGGAIPHVMETQAMVQQHQGFGYPWLHKHNWINGNVFARLHANGVCEVFTRHVNSKFFDDGLTLRDAVPVIGLRCGTAAEMAAARGTFDGSMKALRVGSVEFDLTDAAHLATPEKPGNFTFKDGLLIWQPYRGVELHAGKPTKEITGDEYICRAEDEVMPRGIARTVRFNVSLNPERSARVTRYLPPAWWYGLCEEFQPQPFLPVSNVLDETIRAAVEWGEKWTIHAGFDDGSVARGQGIGVDGRFEPGWEGEVPYAKLLYAWRSGDGVEYDRALRAAYFFTDVCVDHAAKQVRMHAYPPNAFSVPMARVLGSVSAWLETGDPWLLNTARAVIETAYWTHKNSWPRMAVGRDACFTRGAVMLYRYLNEDRYRAIARDALSDAVAAQMPDGAFGDQAGGSGIHQWGAYITKPWMGLMSTNGMIDYLELFPDDQELLDCVRRFGDWLLSERVEREGTMTWAYQHGFRGTRDFYSFYSGEVQRLPTPDHWHREYLARFLGFCATRLQRPEFMSAYMESRRGQEKSMGSDHPYAQALQFVPWLQDTLWQVRLTDQGLRAHPYWFGPTTPATAQVQTPEGVVRLKWNVNEQPEADGCRVTIVRPGSKGTD